MPTVIEKNIHNFLDNYKPRGYENIFRKPPTGKFPNNYNQFVINMRSKIPKMEEMVGNSPIDLQDSFGEEAGLYKREIYNVLSNRNWHADWINNVINLLFKMRESSR